MSALIFANGDLQSFEEFTERASLGGKEAPAGAAAGLRRGAGPAFAPIGIGMPLSIEVLTVYTGDAPGRFFGSPDLLVAAGVKSLQTFEAAPRIICQLVEKMTDKTYYGPAALRKGSTVVYYAPAVLDGTILCSMELVSDSFPKKAFEQFASVLGAASGTPVFAPASAYLLAGSYLVKIVAELGEVLIDGSPYMRSDFAVRFDTPAWEATQARLVVMANERDHAELRTYEPRLVDAGGPGERLALVHRQSGDAYRGDAPFVVVSLDGRRRPELDSYTPTLMTAALLERFYRTEDTTGRVTAVLEQGMKLYNDFAFREKADKYRKLLETLPKGTGEWDRVKVRYDAAVANIGEEAFRPRA